MSEQTLILNDGRRLPERLSSGHAALLDPEHATLHGDALLQRDDDGRPLVLGRGSFSTVYAATDPAGRLLAAKVFRADVDPRLPRREWRYARAELGPRFVRARALYAVPAPEGPDRPDLYVLLLDRVQGPTLLDLIKAGTTPSDVDLVRLTRQGLEGLSARAAWDGSQQRDIKPANIALTRDDVTVADLVFLDHGLARAEGSASTDFNVGTRQYLPPEALLYGQRGPEGDVWALCLTMLEVRQGGWPFAHAAATDDRITTAVLDADPRVPRGLGVLGDVLRGGLVKDPARRPTAARLLAVLDEVDPADPDWDPAVPYAGAADIGTVEGVGTTESLESVSVALDPLSLPGRPAPTVLTAVPGRRPRTAALPEGPLGLPAQGPHELVPVSAVDTPGRPSWTIAFAGGDATLATERGDRIKLSAAGSSMMVYVAYTLAGVTALGAAAGLPLPALPVATLAGVGIARVAIGLDRSIVASSRPRLDDIDNTDIDATPIGPWTRQLRNSMVLRLAFALVFALGISEPCAQLLFHRDVEARLAAQVDAANQSFEAQLDATYRTGPGGLEELAAADRADLKRIDALRAAPGQRRGQAEDERKGVGPTGVPGCGPRSRCQALLDQAEALDSALPGAMTAVQTGLDKRADQETHLRDQLQAAQERHDREQRANNGFLAREKALFQMLWDEPILLFRYAVIIAVLLFVELASLVVKASLSGSRYERAVALQGRLNERTAVAIARARGLRNVAAAELNGEALARRRRQVGRVDALRDELAAERALAVTRRNHRDRVLDLELDDLVASTSVDLPGTDGGGRL